MENKFTTHEKVIITIVVTLLTIWTIGAIAERNFEHNQQVKYEQKKAQQTEEKDKRLRIELSKKEILGYSGCNIQNDKVICLYEPVRPQKVTNDKVYTPSYPTSSPDPTSSAEVDDYDDWYDDYDIGDYDDWDDRKDYE